MTWDAGWCERGLDWAAFSLIKHLLYFLLVLLDYMEDRWKFLLSKKLPSTRKGRVEKKKKRGHYLPWEEVGAGEITDG